MKKDLISMLDIKEYVHEILELATKIKESKEYLTLKNKNIALIFEKPSTRTRVSFEVGINQLGGKAMYLNTNDLQIGRGETIADTARVLSRYVDCIMYRAKKHKNMVELAKYAAIPVINGLDDLEHPCQIMADLLTIKEQKGDLKGLKLAYVGDGNNVCNSLLLGSAIVGMNISVSCPIGYEPNAWIFKEAKKIAKQNKSDIRITHNPKEGVKYADIIYTDVWVSMGDEAEQKQRIKDFEGFQVNQELLDFAKKDCIIMHDLPAHRGLEITDNVIDGKNSVVFDQAENRLHAQKGILVYLTTR